MKIIKTIAIIAALLILLSSCAKEIDRIPFTSMERVEKELILTEAGPIQLWVDLSVKYVGYFSLSYFIELEKDGEPIISAEADAMKVGTKLFYSRMSMGSKQDLKYQGKLLFNSGGLEPGSYTLRVTPTVMGKDYELRKYDIIIKQ